MSYIINGNIDASCIMIKKPQSLGDKNIFRLYYKPDKTSNLEHDFMIQTPVMTIPYSTVRCETPGHTSIQFDCCNDEFIKRLEMVRNSIINRIVRKCGDLMKNKQYSDRILHQGNGKVLRCRVLNSNDVAVYDQLHQKCSWDQVQMERQIQIILWLRWVWVYNDYFGIDYSVVQVKVMTPQQEILFHNDTDTFDKYNKMMKLHIPLPAIEAKMKLDGLTIEDINIFLTSKQAPKQESVISEPKSFLSQISSGDFKLKKTYVPVNPEDQRKTIMGKISKYVDTSRKVPSLDDILDGKSKLRKI